MAKILVVEDEIDTLEVMARQLLKMGHEVSTSTNGQDGLNTAVAFKPDLVITDITMPGLTGFQLSKRLRRNSETNSIPIVVVTGNPQVEDSMRILNVEEFLVKPISIEDFKFKVDFHLRDRSIKAISKANLPILFHTSNRNILLNIMRLFKSDPYISLQKVTKGVDIVAKAVRSQAKVIVVDLLMRDASPVEVIKMLRADKSLKDAIILTYYSDVQMMQIDQMDRDTNLETQVRRFGLDIGANDFLGTFNGTEFHHKIMEHIAAL